MSVALLKRNALSAPFERAFREQKALETSDEQGELMQIHYRDEEAIYIQASPDRVTVIFSTIFREETDRIFGKVFLQVCELSYVKHNNSFLTCVLWSRSSLMQGGNLRFRTLRRSCTRIVILLLKSAMLQV